MSAHIFRSGTYMKVSAGFQALPVGGAADVAGGGSGEGGVPEGEGIAPNVLALVARKDDGGLRAKWIAGEADGEALPAGGDVGDPKSGGAADAKGVGDGTGVS